MKLKSNLKVFGIKLGMFYEQDHAASKHNFAFKPRNPEGATRNLKAP